MSRGRRRVLQALPFETGGRALRRLPVLFLPAGRHPTRDKGVDADSVRAELAGERVMPLIPGTVLVQAQYPTLSIVYEIDVGL